MKSINENYYRIEKVEDRIKFLEDRIKLRDSELFYKSFIERKYEFLTKKVNALGSDSWEYNNQNMLWLDQLESIDSMIDEERIEVLEKEVKFACYPYHRKHEDFASNVTLTEQEVDWRISNHAKMGLKNRWLKHKQTKAWLDWLEHVFDIKNRNPSLFDKMSRWD